MNVASLYHQRSPASIEGLTDKEGVLFVRMRGAAARGPAQLLDGGQGGLDAVQERPSPAGGPEKRRHHRHDLLGAPAQIGEHPVRALHLRGGERRRAGGLGRDGLQVGHDGPQIPFEAIGRLADAPGRGHRKDDGGDLDDRHDQHGDGDDAQKDVRHTSGSVAARNWRAASTTFSRPSRARCPRYSRVSSPVAGAYSNATAAPATAPRMNAISTAPAPRLSSFAIRRYSLSRSGTFSDPP